LKLLMMAMLCFSPCIAGAANEDSPLQKEFSRLLKSSKLKAKNFSIAVVRHGGGQRDVLMSHLADRSRIPASLTKIFTAGAVLDHFSPTDKFKTQLWGRGPISEGRLRGDLILKGGGDPSFVSENMWFLVNEFVRQKIHRISGDIVVDDTLFDGDQYPGRSDHRVDRAYDAPIGAMSFNWNAVNIHLQVLPSEKPQLGVFLDPPNDHVRLVNRAKLGGGRSYRVTRQRKKGHDEVIVSGTFPRQSEPKVVYKVLPGQRCGAVKI